MKKKMMAIALLGILLVSMLAGCGSSAKTVNPTTSSYEDMVSYLTDKGYIDKNCTPVDINKTKGYLTDNTGGQWTDLVVADKANDYNGLWLFYWDGANKSDVYNEIYPNIAVNGKTIVLGGGAAVLPLEGFNGYYGIAFSKDYKNKDAVLKDFNALPSDGTSKE